MPEITASLLMRYFGYFAQEPHGGIYRRLMEIGRIHIVVFVGGEIRGSGKSCLR
jgi:hypothetical protein